MKRVLKIECERAFTGSGFKLALLIGCLISVWHYVDQYIPAAEAFLVTLDDFPFGRIWQHYPGQLYDFWIGQQMFLNTQGEIFYLILPMLAALPFADSYFADAKEGFLRSVCTRTNRLHYFAAKYIAVFLSAFTVVAVPLVLDFLLGMLAFPLMAPLVTQAQTSPGERDTFPWLFYHMPVVYVLLYSLLAGLMGGLLATVSLVFSRILNYRFLVLLAPFIGYMFLASVFPMIGLPYWNPRSILQGTCSGDALPALIVENLVLLVLSLAGFVWKGAREDVF